MKINNIKPSYDEKRTCLGEVYPLHTPFTVIIDVSEACNFRCQYCFRSQDDSKAWGYAGKKELMKWELFKKAIQQIQGFPEEVKTISLSNHGEPLCNRKLPDMVRYIKKQRITSRVSIHTNASLLDEQYAKELAESQIDRIVISLQGLNAEKYLSVCAARIDFEVFYQNLEMLYRYKKNTEICIKIMDVALEEGEDESFYQLFSPIADRVFIEKMVPIWKDVDFEKIKDEKHLAYNKYGEGFPPQKSCPLIFHTIVISPNGDVYPCTQLLTPYILGNICENNLVDLWNSEMRKKLLRQQCTCDTPQICSDCFIRQNSIFTKEDMIDDYREQILRRIK